MAGSAVEREFLDLTFVDQAGAGLGGDVDGRGFVVDHDLLLDGPEREDDVGANALADGDGDALAGGGGEALARD